MNDKNIQLREAALNTLGIYNNIINEKIIIKKDELDRLNNKLKDLNEKIYMNKNRIDKYNELIDRIKDTVKIVEEWRNKKEEGSRIASGESDWYMNIGYIFDTIMENHEIPEKDIITYYEKLEKIIKENNQNKDDENKNQKDDIKNVIYSSLSIPCNYYNDFINFLNNNIDDKLCVNTMIGCFKPKVRENWNSLCFTSDCNVAFYHFIKNNAVFINHIDINDKTYYEVYLKSNTSYEETEAPIYNLVLELEAIELHKLTKVIESNQGYILDLSTDCVLCVFLDCNLPFELDDKKLLYDFIMIKINFIYVYCLKNFRSLFYIHHYYLLFLKY